MLLNDAKWQAFIQKPDAVTLQNDPAYAYAGGFVKLPEQIRQLFPAICIKEQRPGTTIPERHYADGPEKKMYPDATFTMRVSYGNVKSYSPKDGVKYRLRYYYERRFRKIYSRRLRV